MTFEFQDTIMDDFDSIQVVTPPLVDPLTEAANAHMAALAEAEAAEIIVKQSSQEETEPETENTASTLSKDNPKAEKKLKKFASSTSASSSSASLSETGQVVVPQIKNDTEEESNDKENKDEDDDDAKVPIQPTPLAEEYKEPGIMYFLNVPPVTLLDDRERPPKILKEPRGLYAAKQDLSSWQTVPRWPAESQVLPQRIKHIRSVPGVPEIFYEPSGKEPCPRPLGEDHGMVVFDYMPTSPVNYFSRSVLGPSKDHPPDPSAAPLQILPEPPLPDCLRFESRFESGNLAKVIRITEAYYEIYLRPDYYTSKHCQWFYFQVQNMRSDITYRFSIVNFSKPDSLYNYGMKPVLYSQIEAEKHFVGWSRVGSNIRYYRNESMFDEDEGYSFTLTFTINFPHDNDTVYLAHCYPYTYSDLQEDLAAIQNNPARAQFCSQRLLCRTLAGNNVYILTITAPASQEDMKRKAVIVLSARVHPGETPSSWIMRGILHFLTGDSDVSTRLRDNFIFKIVPMLNPDGCIVGNTRCSLAARDLNRQYKSVIKEAFPSVFNVKTLVRRLMEESGVVFYCDLHAHSRKFNVFIYGCENRRHSEKYLREQVYPLMLHKNTAEKFSFEDCRFKIQRQKETTGRVVFWNMGITCSYTLEASYGGTNMGSRAFTHFNTDDYEGIGRYFCETLLDFHDPCPVKEQLRNKIVGRLLKEGSNADEPANIALSDYSSLSSGCESSSCDEDVVKNNKNADGDDEDAEEAIAAAEERKRVRKLRSRRDRSKNGAQFTQTLYPDFRQVEKFMHGQNKSFSELDIKKSVLAKNAFSRPKAGKKAKKKFKRSLTMTTLPLQAFFAKAASAAASVAANENKADKNTLFVNSNGKKYTNNNSEQNVTKFTIGTSDEEESNDEDRDLEKLFCPLTDKNGAPFDSQGEIVSSSNCRRVQSEIMASVSRIKSSILGRKGGFLHTYAMLESNDTGGSVPVSLNTSPSATTPVKQKKSPNETHQSLSNQKPKLKNSRSQGSLKLRSKSPGPILMRDSITVSLPSPAGNRKPENNKSKAEKAIKKWDKTKTRKRLESADGVFGAGTRSRINSSASNSSLKLLDSGSETPPMKHGSKSKGNSKKKKSKSLTHKAATNNSQSTSKLKA